MELNDFDYYLPEELIAQHPAEKRNFSRLLVLDRKTGGINHRRFDDLSDYLKPGDLLVVNNTKVIPARLYGEKKDTGVKCECLLLKQLDDNRWETLVRPGRRLKPGAEIVFGEGELRCVVEKTTDDGGRICRFFYEGIFAEVLDRLGEVPLPPYITEKLDDGDRYQTVYARHRGSAAAPTAGLHFTEEMLDSLRSRGVETAEVLLHVGLGTFRPVKTENILEHKMHSEYYEISEENAQKINSALAEGRRVISVGTTSTRTLESSFDGKKVVAGSGWTDIFIYPGYEFKVITGLLTNFHLPKSTLIMLVSALAGRENVLGAYEEAVKERYRFFSFGDAMLII